MNENADNKNWGHEMWEAIEADLKQLGRPATPEETLAAYMRHGMTAERAHKTLLSHRTNGVQVISWEEAELRAAKAGLTEYLHEVRRRSEADRDKLMD